MSELRQRTIGESSAGVVRDPSEDQARILTFSCLLKKYLTISTPPLFFFSSLTLLLFIDIFFLLILKKSTVRITMVTYYRPINIYLFIFFFSNNI